MSTDYLRLPVFNAAGDVHLVVESPKGARAKLKYEPRLCAFLYSRPLMCGLCYPFDWGFVPSTCAPDGDPLDGMILHEAETYPGVVIACRPVAILEVEQTEKGVKNRNDRLIFSPVTAQDDINLADTLKTELIEFFIGAVHGTGKSLRILGWKDAAEALAAVKHAAGTFKESIGRGP